MDIVLLAAALSPVLAAVVVHHLRGVAGMGVAQDQRGPQVKMEQLSVEEGVLLEQQGLAEVQALAEQLVRTYQATQMLHG
jgi:hypothetical protein